MWSDNDDILRKELNDLAGRIYETSEILRIVNDQIIYLLNNNMFETDGPSIEEYIEESKALIEQLEIDTIQHDYLVRYFIQLAPVEA